MNHAKRIKELAIETLIAAAVVAAFITYLFSKPKGHHVNLQPLAVVINAAIVFGYLISWFRAVWKNFLFWTAAGALLVAHVVFYLVILEHFHHVPMAVYALIDVVELVMFSQLTNRFVLKRHPHGKPAG